jgi:hypothetical protein
MLSGPEIALAAAAFLIGLTGTWSPCGFSMVDTIGPTGHTGGCRTAIAAAATFAPGAVAGGIVTFGALAALGGVVHGAGVTPAYLVAAAIAVVAAVAEARGTPIVPQIRRQLPERWRRVLPMPVAAAGYGVLLGLGFTTFVLSFGVWAIAGMSFAIGDAGAGVVIGAAFGVGRALPIAVLAPVADRPFGIRATELMAERPAIYHGARMGDALALLVAAVVLTTAASASAARPEADPGADPSVEAGDLAWQLPDRSGVLRSAAQETPAALPGGHPALGGPYVAVATGLSIRLLARQSLRLIAEVPAPEVDAVAVSSEWLVYRARRDGRDVMVGRSIADPGHPGEEIAISSAGGGSQLGIPSLHGGLTAFAIAERRANRIVTYAFGSQKGRTVVASHKAALTSASVEGDGRKTKLLYVRATRKRQRLMIKRVGRKGPGHAILSRKGRRPMMWSTALSAERAYVTLLSRGGSRIVSVRR